MPPRSRKTTLSAVPDPEPVQEEVSVDPVEHLRWLASHLTKGWWEEADQVDVQGAIAANFMGNKDTAANDARWIIACSPATVLALLDRLGEAEVAAAAARDWAREQTFCDSWQTRLTRETAERRRAVGESLTDAMRQAAYAHQQANAPLIG